LATDLFCLAVSTPKCNSEKGKHYGRLTPKCLDVLEVLLWGFHNARSGLCFPSLAGRDSQSSRLRPLDRLRSPESLGGDRRLVMGQWVPLRKGT
jgi:hypothetical protein